MFIAIDNLSLEARPSRSRSLRNGQAAGLDTWGSPCQTGVFKEKKKAILKSVKEHARLVYIFLFLHKS